MKSLLRSNVEFATCSIYELPQAWHGEFDLAFFFGVLYHLRHPLHALDAVRAALRPGGQTFIETAIADHELGAFASYPLVQFCRRDELAGDASNWFVPSSRALMDWCYSCGFAPVLVGLQPPEAPQRCIVKATRTEGEPEFSLISYEQPRV